RAPVIRPRVCAEGRGAPEVVLDDADTDDGAGVDDATTGVRRHQRHPRTRDVDIGEPGRRLRGLRHGEQPVDVVWHLPESTTGDLRDEPGRAFGVTGLQGQYSGFGDDRLDAVPHPVVLGQRGLTCEEVDVISVTSDLGALLVVDGERVRYADVGAES